VIKTPSPLKQFALPILCDLPAAAKSCRMLLWQQNGLDMYLDLLEDQYFAVTALEAIMYWYVHIKTMLETSLDDTAILGCMKKLLELRTSFVKVPPWSVCLDASCMPRPTHSRTS
jgi:hypothetical protein